MNIRPWQALLSDPLGQVKSISFKASNGMGGRREVRDTEAELLKFYGGRKLTNKEILNLDRRFDLSHYVGLYVGGAYNPKHTQLKFEDLRVEIGSFIKRVYLDPFTDEPPQQMEIAA